MTAHAAEPTVADLAVDYAASRSADDLARLRDAVRRSPGFDPGLDVVGAVSPLLARGAYAEVVDMVRELMPGAFLSPAAHAALAAARRALGDTVRSDVPVVYLLGSGASMSRHFTLGLIPV